jgi:hypothetical protein
METPSKRRNTMRTFTKVSARLIAAVFAVASIATVAQAQSQSFAGRVKVPFAFQTASGQHFQPGVYTISNTGLQTMLIRGTSDTGLVIFSQENEGAPVPQGKAIFTHYGDKYYLRSVSATGSSTRLLFSASKEERQAQKARARHAKTVELAMLQAGR